MNSRQDDISLLTAQIAALTARVYKLEQKTGIALQGASEKVPQEIAPPAISGVSAELEAAATPISAVPLLIAAQPARPPMAVHARAIPETTFAARQVVARDAELEKRIGQYWLNRIGIVAILIGVSYFLKYAFENDWIGPTGRIVIGLLAGIGLMGWSERFRRRGYQAFSYSLKGLGIGTLYLSLWAAFQVYRLIPAGAAFAAMVIVTATTITLAITQDTELLVAFALIGGFSTPVLLSTGQNHEVALFSYVALLDAGMIAMAIVKPWRRLLWGSFAGTILLYAGWSLQYYSRDQRPVTVTFTLLFAALFAAVPLLSEGQDSARLGGPSVTLTLLGLFNASSAFLALYSMYQRETDSLAWYSLGMAGAYLAMSWLLRSRSADASGQFLHLLHVAIAVAFITIAIPLKLDAPWITIGWLVESAALLWLSVKMGTNFLRYLAVGALALGIGRLLLFDNFQTDRLIFNARFATYALAIAILGGIVKFGSEHASEAEKPFLKLAAVLFNLLALVALTREAADYFDRELYALNLPNLHSSYFAQIRLARDFSYSAIWLGYGVVLMTIGFVKRSAFVRWQALVLTAVTIVKVFLYDVSALDKGYRILSFVALGAVLLGISFVYQRDWLRLSRPVDELANENQ